MIILTGAAGFIGSHLADALGKKHRLLLVDNPQHFRDRGYLPPQEASLWDWATGNERSETRHKILDRSYFPKVLNAIGPEAPAGNPAAKEHVLIPKGEKIEWVVHIGACTDTAESRKDFLDQWNVNYTKAIWDWCTKHQVPLVYASSGATYGAGEHGFSDSWETALQLRPLNAYGQSKQDFDVWAHEEARAGRTPPAWYGLKFFNVYGPREAHKGPMASAILHSYRHILRHGSCRLFRSHHPEVKDGEQSRDFIHVKDILSLTEFVMAKQPESGLYNCGTGKARTFYSMMEALFAALDKPMKVDWLDTPEQYRKAYQYFTEASMEKMLAAGYQKPFASLEEGVSSYVRWLQENDPTPVVEAKKFQ
jgi:ADP-L-glycero-D-manno-heptose 6-epimerase